MSPRKRFFIGGFGALMPVLVSLLAIDIGAMLDDDSYLTTGNIIGVFIRYIILFMIGGFVAYLHDDEIKPFKLFEIGIAAPALISSLITAQGISSPKAPEQVKQTSWSIISSAYAADDAKESSFFSDLINGVSGAIYRERDTGKSGTTPKSVPQPVKRPEPPAKQTETSRRIRLRALQQQEPGSSLDIHERIEALNNELTSLESEIRAAKATVEELENQYRQKMALKEQLMRMTDN